MGLLQHQEGNEENIEGGQQSKSTHTEKLGILIPKKVTQYDQWCEKGSGPLVRVWLHFGSTFSSIWFKV